MRSSPSTMEYVEYTPTPTASLARAVLPTAAGNASVGADAAELTEDMQFNSSHVVSIACYSVLLVISAAGNITVLAALARKRSARARINRMLMHLAIADLLVTFLMMPLEIAWAATVSWDAGDFMCRLMAVCRVFGLFLSSFVLVCISMDRYFAILQPMNLTAVDLRGRVMLATAWAMSLLCSLPQAMVFSVQNHPNVTSYEQCMTWGVLETNRARVLYAIFSSAFMYGLPLLIIIFAYTSIIMEIYRRARETGDDVFRRSSLGFLGRAKTRTLKMTLVIVLVFFMCWTPYNIMTFWYWLDRESARLVDGRIQRGLFIFACTNSCMNPIVYGAFNIRRRDAAADGGGASAMHARGQNILRHQSTIHNHRSQNQELPRVRIHRKWQNGTIQGIQRCLSWQLVAAKRVGNSSLKVLS